MPKIEIIQKGNISFFYRPKVQHEEAHGVEEVQRFFSVLKPDSSSEYLLLIILLIIGKKYMPEKRGQPFFAFVDHVTENLDDLRAALNKHQYGASNRGERELPSARCIGEGKYLIAGHEDKIFNSSF